MARAGMLTGRPYRTRVRGQDPALTHAVLLMGLAGVIHGSTLLWVPSAFASGAWQESVFTILPRPAFGVILLVLGLFILLAALGPVTSEVLGFALLLKALTVTVLAWGFAAYAIGHASRGLWTAESLPILAGLQLVIALRTLRLR